MHGQQTSKFGICNFIEFASHTLKKWRQYFYFASNSLSVTTQATRPTGASVGLLRQLQMTDNFAAVIAT